MSERPKVVLLGCFHQAQFLIPREVQSCWCQPSADFAECLKTVVNKYGITFIGEEAAQAQDRVSSAATLAEARAIRYKNIDIPQCAQAQIQVRPRDGTDSNGQHVNYEGKDEYRIAWDLVREYHMYQTFLEFQKGRNPSLLICGTGHQRRLVLLLSKDFEVVEETFDLQLPGGND